MEKKLPENISYILQFIDRARFMASSLSNLVRNLSERFKKLNVNTDTMIKKYCDCFLEYINFKDHLTQYKCLCCNDNYQQKFDEKLKEQFFNTYKFSTHDNNKLILLLRKGVYPYEYMDD